MRQKAIAIVGPTATGKSRLAIALARAMGGDIVSADSRQVYAGLDIGAGKVTQAEQRLARHYLLDVTHPRHVYTATHFTRDARRAVTAITQRGHVPIIVGGTGFWIDTFLRGETIPNVPPNPTLRRKLQKLSLKQLFRRLKKLDPRRAKTIDPHNPVRLIRALEILASTGHAIPRRRTATPYDVLWLGLDLPTPALRRRIHVRLQQRLRQGMVAEVRRLLASGVSAKRLRDLGLEYRFVTRYVQGELTRTQLDAQLETAIWHYAKHQRTWFKRHDDIHWVSNAKAALRLSRAFVKT